MFEEINHDAAMTHAVTAAQAEHKGIVTSRSRVHVWHRRDYVRPIKYTEDSFRSPMFDPLTLRTLENKANRDKRSGKRGPRAA